MKLPIVKTPVALKSSVRVRKDTTEHFHAWSSRSWENRKTTGFNPVLFLSRAQRERLQFILETRPFIRCHGLLIMIRQRTEWLSFWITHKKSAGNLIYSLGNLTYRPERQCKDLPLLENMLDDIFPYWLSCPNTEPRKQIISINVMLVQRCKLSINCEKVYV